MTVAPKVFLDTNAWLSAAVFPGLSVDLLLAAAVRAAGEGVFVSGDERVPWWDAPQAAMRIVSPRGAWGMLVMAGPRVGR